jgi:hypothetical protein
MSVRWRTFWLGLAVLLARYEIWNACAEETPSVQEVLRQAVARTQQTEVAGSAYTYTKVNTVEELDSGGKVKERKENVYQVRFQGGSSSAKLLGVDGHIPSGADLKRHAENEGGFRQFLGKPKGAKGDNRESFLTPELVSRFDFKLCGQELINARNSYRVSFRAKSPGMPQHHLVDKVLDRLSGTLWIDAVDFEVARADVQLDSEVDLLGGFIGCLRKLDFTMSRVRMADGVWLSGNCEGNFDGRKLLEPKRLKWRAKTGNFRVLTAS